MTARRVDFPTLPPKREQEAWCTWLRAHGIDPMDVHIPGGIKVDDAAHTITYLAMHRDGLGAHLEGACDGLGISGSGTTLRPACTEMVERPLETPVLPFPAVASGEESAA